MANLFDAFIVSTLILIIAWMVRKKILFPLFAILFVGCVTWGVSLAHSFIIREMSSSKIEASQVENASIKVLQEKPYEPKPEPDAYLIFLCYPQVSGHGHPYQVNRVCQPIVVNNPREAKFGI